MDRIVSVTFLLSMFTLAAHACTCVAFPGAKAAMQDASVVFRGTVIKSEMLPQHPEMRGEEPYATMVYVAVDTGLRVSEVIGLRWSDIHEQSITIDERLLQGRLGRAEERYLQYDHSGQPD
jgi:hypothetical protein